MSPSSLSNTGRPEDESGDGFDVEAMIAVSLTTVTEDEGHARVAADLVMRAFRDAGLIVAPLPPLTPEQVAEVNRRAQQWYEELQDLFADEPEVELATSAPAAGHPEDETPCDGSSDPRQRCGKHHATGLASLGGYECCCGEYWTSKNECSTGAKKGEPVSARLKAAALLWFASCEIDGPSDADDFVDAVLAVRDEEIEKLRHASATESRINFELRADIARRMALAEKDVCSGCMQREEARDRAMESARQVGVKYEAAKEARYKADERAEKAEELLRDAKAALIDLSCCDDPSCSEQACNHVLPRISAFIAALEGRDS